MTPTVYIYPVPIDREILDRSFASDAFKADLRAYAMRQDAPSIVTARNLPRVKVLRLLTQLLASHPEFRVERVLVDAHSGCSDFFGTVVAEGAGDARMFEFTWDCRWRAEQEGWLDAFGFPDQIRAAEEFGWRCFAQWAERPAGATGRSGPAMPRQLTMKTGTASF